MMPHKKTVQRKKKGSPQGALGVAGFFRVNVVNPDGTIAGDSGWCKNAINTNGLAKYIVATFMRQGASSSLASVALGSSSVASSTVTALTSVTNVLATWTSMASAWTSTRAASTDPVIARYTANWTSNAFGGNVTIAVAGMAVASNSEIFCQGNFNSSAVSNNQAINLTYDINFYASNT